MPSATLKIKGTDIVFAESYQRVVVGGKGPYIEFIAGEIKLPLKVKPGQEWRGKGKYESCKYFWLCPVGFEDIKVYVQRRRVSYADYQVGSLYVSPDQLEFEGKLYAQYGNAPGINTPGTYPL